ncbi:MAG: hypothetical protein HHJ17_06485 [Rhodoferax sp.]|uniref:hypothetical protein n=1 Tax=Rhodoferax sp. TaxID=50421 RepID=UPI00182B87EE|nr:hypothetical protein [Rhodoferax sp.]NMM13171.1 hypothetical protein [Rhodoferax sp.]
MSKITKREAKGDINPMRGDAFENLRPEDELHNFIAASAKACVHPYPQAWH